MAKIINRLEPRRYLVEQLKYRTTIGSDDVYALQKLWPETIASQVIQTDSLRFLAQNSFTLGGKRTITWDEGQLIAAGAAGSQPLSPKVNERFFDETNNTLQYWTGSAWATIESNVYTGSYPSNPPSSPTYGTRWFDETTNVLYTYNVYGAYASDGSNYLQTIQKGTVSGETTLTLPNASGTIALVGDTVAGADQIETIASTTNADFFLTFVDSNNGSLTLESLYTFASLKLNPSTGAMDLTGSLEVDNVKVDGNTISTVDSNGNLILSPNGTGDVYIDANILRVGDQNANTTITTYGTGDLVLNTNEGTSSGSITIADGVNGNITISPDGSGKTIVGTDLQVNGGDILDSNGNESIRLTATSSAVNEITVANAATGNAPSISATGDNTDIDLKLQPKGNGSIVVGTGSATANVVSSGSQDIVIKTGNATTGTITIEDGLNGDITVATTGSGAAVFSNATDASSSTAASVEIAGGVGIAKKLYVGTDLNVAGSTTLGDAVNGDTTTINGVTTINASTTGNAKSLLVKNGSTELFTIDAEGDTIVTGSLKVDTVTIDDSTISTTADTLTLNPKSGDGDENAGTVVIKGNLQVDGTTTTINSTVSSIDDLDLVLAAGAANAAAADGAGLLIGSQGSPIASFFYNSVDGITNSWNSSEHFVIPSDKAYYIGANSVLNATTLGSAVVSSSLTKIGSLSGGTAGFVKVDASGNLTADSNTYLNASTSSTQSGYFGNIFLFDDVNPSHYLGITNSADLTAARTLSINVNDADRTISLSGSLTISDASKTIAGAGTSLTIDNNLDLAGTTGQITLGSSTHTMAFTTTANTSVTLPTSGTLYGTATGSITSSQLATSLTDETGTGSVVFSNSPTLVTPTLGAALATSINGVTITETTNGFELAGGTGNENKIVLNGDGSSTGNITLNAASDLSAGFFGNLTVGASDATGNITVKSNGSTARSLTLSSDSTIGALTSGHVLYASATNTIGSEASLATSRGGTGLTAIGSAYYVLRTKSDTTGLEYSLVDDNSLTTTGVTAGKYSAVTVNAQGRVTAGEQIVQVGYYSSSETETTNDPAANLAEGGIFFEALEAGV